MNLSLLVCLLFAVLLPACSSMSSTHAGGVFVARLDRSDRKGFAEIRAQFTKRNPGYDIAYYPELGDLEASERPRVVFVQSEPGSVTIDSASGAEQRSEATVGDVVLVRPGEVLRSVCAGLVFEVPDPLPTGLPSFVRPDWDDAITDTPGGCATETGAYRRILLTWLDGNGPYVYHALNAHRVRITDSFSHYHPKQGGFDEFYLVQMSNPTSLLLTSEKTERIVAPASVSADEASSLLTEHRLRVGDLVYIPRGVVHRGLGGVLAQVITVPGFRPGAEIGVDHYLQAINERLALNGPARLPVHAAAAHEAVVK